MDKTEKACCGPECCTDKPENKQIACCTRPTLENRPLLTFKEAVNVMALLKVLANDTRLRLLHHLIRNKEASVGEMATTLGMKQQAVSNQLTRLSDTGILASRRDGNNILYRVEDCCVPLLLDQALCIMEDQNRLPKSGQEIHQ